ncbi:MAG: hypothetical protein V1809_08830 [Planctomycetota bacterium]
MADIDFKQALETISKMGLKALEEACQCEAWLAQSRNDNLSAKMEIARHLVAMAAEGHADAVFILGEGGIGKTYLTLKTLDALSEDYVYCNGYVTPLSLFKFLQANKDRIVVLDDIEGVLRNETSLAILKAATWGARGRRVVSYSSTSEKAADVKSSFEFSGRIILLGNHIPDENPSFSAMLSRFFVYEMGLSHEEKMGILFEILERRDDLEDPMKETIKNIIQGCVTPFTENFNFRTLEKLVSVLRHTRDIFKAEIIFRGMLTENEDEKIAWALIREKGLSAMERAARFYEITGLSRRDYFLMQQRLSKRFELGSATTCSNICKEVTTT